MHCKVKSWTISAEWCKAHIVYIVLDNKCKWCKAHLPKLRQSRVKQLVIEWKSTLVCKVICGQKHGHIIAYQFNELRALTNIIKVST